MTVVEDDAYPSGVQKPASEGLWYHCSLLPQPDITRQLAILAIPVPIVQYTRPIKEIPVDAELGQIRLSTELSAALWLETRKSAAKTKTQSRKLIKDHRFYSISINQIVDFVFHQL